MKRPTVLFPAVLLGAALLASSAAADTVATGGAGGVYPPGVALTGVTLNGLQSGFGIEIHLGGAALGQFTAVLLGVSALGAEQTITLEGEVTSGSQPAANVAVLSGAATLDMGDGSPPTPGVPFTATVTTDGNSQGTIGLLIGVTSLPAATVNVGSMTIE
jgi:hypothetical protein